MVQTKADNIFSASSASGHPNDTVQIQLSLSNTDNVVAFQAEIPLGNSLSYIPNSCVLSSRSNGHTITASVVNGVLKIFSYSLSLSSYSGNSGVLATFRLRLGNEPGNINLTLNNTRLSNSTGQAITHTTNNGVITLLSPKIRINNPQIDFGHYPIHSTYNNSIIITNIGNEPLIVNNISFSNPVFSSNGFSAFTLGTGNSSSIPISFSPNISGNVSATATIYSNSISGNQNVSLIANPYSVNELHVSNVEGYSDSIVIINLSINNMDTIVGFQTKFILPQALEYVNGSFSLSSRSNNHACISGISGDTLTLLIYSPNNSPINNNSGIIASFGITLNGSGYYYLQPINTLLSDRNGVNVLSNAYSGSVSIRSPYLYCDNSINMGTSSVTENTIYSYSINNYGSAPLVIDNIVFTQNGFSIQDTLPIIINEYNNRNINIVYNGANEGNFSAVLKIYSNDPNQRLKDVNITGNRYEPNELLFTSDTSNYLQNSHFSVLMNNYSSITAVQLDFYYLHNYYNVSSSDFVLSSARCPNHSISATTLNDSVYRILIFSMQNQNINFNSGEILKITLHPKTTTRQGIYNIKANSIVLSNSSGINKFTGTNPAYYFNVLIPTFTISTQSNNNSFGNVTGGGVYNHLSTATLSAIPNQNSVFLQWNDYDTNRIRNITVTNDSSFTAYFKRIDTIYLNQEICQGSTFDFFGQTLSTPNIYSYTKNVNQYQDSVFILNLIINQPKTTNLTAEICQGETYSQNGFNVSTTGIHTLNLQTYKGCDSIVNITLTVNQPQATNLSEEICQGEIYTLNGFNVNTAGLHTQTLQTYKGCDSTVNLTLTVNQPQTTNLTAEICQGETYTLNGFNVNTAGLHTRNLQTYKGCDSTVNLTLIVNQPQITNLTAEICHGETYTQNGFNVSTAGLHTQALQTYKGCDSTVNLTLTVNQPQTTNLTAEICQGETYTQNGFNVNTAGLHTQALQTYKGCDSTVNLTLIVNQPQITNLTAEICQGETYSLNGFNVNIAGLHTQTLQTYKGCDSIVNLTLTVNQPQTTNLTAEICQGETYAQIGFNVSTAGLHTQTLQTYKGCDSIVNLNLTVNPNKTTNFFAIITQGETYNQNGFNETTTGIYTQNLQTYKGCDSIVTLTLNVYPAITNNILAEICQGETYNQNGFNESTEGIYSQTFTGSNGIDSIVTLILTINQPATTNLTAEICQGEIYTQNGFNVSTAGLHTRTLQTYKGCDSTVNLTLTVNQPATTILTAEICQGETYILNGFNVNTAGLHTQTLQTYKGCDSTVNLTLIVNQPQTTNLSAEICQGETYTQNGFNVSTAGIHTQNLQTSKGCDSIVNLTLTTNQPAITNLNAEICQGETYTLNGFNVNISGQHTQNLFTSKGCDSIINLSLTVNPVYNDTIIAEICSNEYYTLNGFNVNTAGLHTLNLQTTKGCDSTVNLTLTINQPQTTNLTAEICQGETYTQNGFNVSTAGIHTQTLQTIKGCDSIVNLTLSVNQSQTTNLIAEICHGETYTLNGFNVNTEGLHTQTLQTYKGCDSIINLTLTVNLPYATNIFAEICQGETYNQNGFNVSTSGTYTQFLQTTKGCDSIVNLVLTVNPTYITTYNETVCQGESYIFNGITYTADTSGRYVLNLQTVNGCDSILELNLTVIPTPIIPNNLELQLMSNYINLTWQGNGNTYVIYRNNDSLTTTTTPIYSDYDLINDQLYCYKVKSINGECKSEFSDTICTTFLDLVDISSSNISTKLYPNPANNKVKLEIEGLNEDTEVNLYDINGRKLMNKFIKANQKVLEIDISKLVKGIYNIRIENDKISISRKLIVN